ncbi:hypothetical protein [Stenotrophomonas sp. P5_B8]
MLADQKIRPALGRRAGSGLGELHQGGVAATFALDRGGELGLLAAGRRADILAFQRRRRTLRVAMRAVGSEDVIGRGIQRTQRALHRIATEQQVADLGAACADQCLQGVTQLPTAKVFGHAKVPAPTVREGATQEALWPQVIQIPGQTGEVAVHGVIRRPGEIGSCRVGLDMDALARECHDRAEFFEGGIGP